ncbi:uncharacterized protein PV06_11497 [Exophiala oligosperma]|uniref:FAD/NAD(P)-binding domain-containing protein n=1 Tax=Exophiala oligosperma TaxID=215243 RepID=A0A0D2A7B8_9EURO|nr:uncharacterized protein PV06_11497 [Exophiala oligosperma]KIW36226.1 hypothetical protein PV06_11497 [Exophiala oligosperma]
MGSIGSDNFAQAEAKYDAERDRRIRPDGATQFVDTTRSAKFTHFAQNPWIKEDPPTSQAAIEDGDHVRVLILGAGYGGLTYAVRLMEASIDVKDMLLVDAAGGFGGTWYWNRYPGLMCDVQSTLYMPLLEETGYTPKHRYSYGNELREYANLVADKWGLNTRALFKASVKSTEWDEEKGEWRTTIRINLDTNQERDIMLRSDFFCLNGGILVHPKLPLLPGVESYNGQTFHTSRWDYSITGGSSTDPNMVKLKGKRVGIVGTGATSIQVVPELAKWAQELFVFQRTPSAVDTRGQKPLDPQDLAQTKKIPGWQRAYRENMAAFLVNPVVTPEKDLVQDAWTSFPSFSGLVGSPRIKDIPPEKTAQYVQSLHTLDFPRQDAIRTQVDDLVKDKATAEALKPWYPGWCKRPCFHDEYLPTFNQPHVHLVDTAGKGVDRMTPSGICVRDKEYEVDVLIFATGYEPWGAGSPAYRAGIEVKGRDGVSLDEKWTKSLATLHGLLTRNFPNMFLSAGGSQGGTTVNVVHTMDVYAMHIAKIITQASKGARQGQKIVVEPTDAGEADWTMRVVKQAHGAAGLIGCTPSYITGEGKAGQEKTDEERLHGAKRAGWMSGLLDYIDTIKAWEDEGKLYGLEVRYKPIGEGYRR